MKGFLSLAALVGLVLVVSGSGVWAADSAVKAESGSAAPAVAAASATAANVPSGAVAADAKTFQEELAAAKVLPARPAVLLIQTALDNKNRLEFTDDQVKALNDLLAVANGSVPQSAVPAVVFPEGTPPAEANKLTVDDRENHLRVDLMKILKGNQAKHLAIFVNKLPASPVAPATAPQSAAPAAPASK
jgi:hypothetical protein